MRSSWRPAPSEFVAAATVLLGESRVTWGQGIRAIYYAGLTLARMNDKIGFAKHDVNRSGFSGDLLSWAAALWFTAIIAAEEARLVGARRLDFLTE